MSTAARALLDEVKARRESTLPASSGFGPFPDFDRTLQTLTDEGFSFNLDPKLADEAEFAEPLPDFDLASSVPFHRSYIEAFPALRSGFGFVQPTPGYPHNINLPIYNPATLRTSSGHSHHLATQSSPCPERDSLLRSFVNETTSTSSPVVNNARKFDTSLLDIARRVSR
jgi:hypothetical protein